MSWTRFGDVRGAVQKLWDQGVLLKELVEPSGAFPRPLRLRGPTSRELGERFGEVRGWIEELRGMRNCRVELREVKHRVLGANQVPDALWIDTLDDALSILAKRRDASAFSVIVERTRIRQPLLLPWLARRPLRALELAAEWDRLLDIVTWLQANPRPDVYLREVDLPGVHTKFIEAHRGVLAEMLDCALPAEHIDERAVGPGGFLRRFGFREKSQGVRFRMLDARHALLPMATMQDVTLDADSFAQLEPAVERVFITENEINFIAFPAVEDSMAVFGAGYGFEALGRANWLSGCRIYYWGDIDTHGFAILDQLRGSFPHVESFLMDRQTLLAFHDMAVVEESQRTNDLLRLTADERALYDDLRDQRLGRNLRLEQERIGFGWVLEALRSLC